MSVGQKTVVRFVLAIFLAGIVIGPAAQSAGAGPAGQTRIPSAVTTDSECGGPGNPCMFGPEPPPPGVDPSVPVTPDFSASAEDGYAECDGDGKSGKRIQMMYFYGEGQPDRFAQFSDSFRIWATHMDDVYQNSAAKTGGKRYIRFVHGSDCKISVKKLQIPAALANDYSLFGISDFLEGTSYYSNDRKVVAFIDVNSASYCGVGLHYSDDSPGQANYNNTYFGVAVVYNGCWNNGRTLAHELGHMLGAVQESAPNYSDEDGHCTDNWDVMCYYYQPVVCSDPVNKLLLDCNNDDYFNTNPAPGTYLADHWNVANSAFLGKPVPTMKLDKTSSKYNGVVTVTLTNFKPNVNINVKWPGNVLLSTVKADATGKATTTFKTPLVPLGDYQVRASNSQGDAATAMLRVVYRIKLGTVSGKTGEEIRVYFYGFSPGDRVEVRFYDASETSYKLLTTVKIAENGRGTKLVTIPIDTTVGKHKVVGKLVGVSKSTSTYFTVTGLGSSEDPTATPTASVTASPTETGTPEPTPTSEIVPTETPTIEAPTPEPTVEAPTETPTSESPTPEPTQEIPEETPTEEPLPAETPAPTQTPGDLVWARSERVRWS